MRKLNVTEIAHSQLAFSSSMFQANTVTDVPATRVLQAEFPFSFDAYLVQEVQINLPFIRMRVFFFFR